MNMSTQVDSVGTKHSLEEVSDHISLSRATQPLRLRIVRNLEEIDQIRSTWTSMQHHPNSDVNFYLTFVRSSTEFVRPHIIVVYRGCSPEAMLIGRLEHRPIECKIGYTTLFRPHARVMNFVYEAVLGNLLPDASQLLVCAVKECLSKSEADIAAFNYLRIDSPLYKVIMRSTRQLISDYLRRRQMHWNMTVPRTPEDFRRALSRKVRKNQRWTKLLHDYPGKIRIECVRQPAGLDRMFEDVEQIARQTYQRGLGAGFVSNTMMRDRFELEAGRGWLRAHILYVNDQPCAFWIGTLYQGTYYSGFMGYDPAYSRYSPGMFLIMQVIEGMCTHNDDERILNIDWGLGHAHYKETLSSSQWQESSVHLFAPTMRGTQLALLMGVSIFLEQLGQEILQRTQLVERIKKSWRRRVRQE